MANNNNSFDISGKLNIDVSSANKAIQRLAKDFESLEKSRGISRLADDLKKLQPVIGEIDKRFSGFIDKLAKNTAFDRVKALTATLEDQKNRLKQYTMEVDKLTNKLNSLPEGGRAWRKASRQREAAIENGRITAAGMESNASERGRYQEQLASPTRDMLTKTARIVELMNMGLQNAAAITQRQDMFKVMAGAQASAPGNMLGQMMLYNPMTYAAIHKDLGGALSAANKSALGQLATKLPGDATNAGVAGLQAASNFNVQNIGMDAVAKGTMGAMVNAGQTFANDPYYYIPQTKQAYAGAKYGQERSSVIQAVLQNKQLATQMNEEIGSKAPMRVGALEAMGGRFGNESDLWYKGQAKHGAGMGFYEQETAGLISQLNRSGLGAGGTDVGDYQRLQRQGFGGAGQLIGQMAGMGGMLQGGSAAEQQRTFIDALHTGVKMGVDDSSLGPDFAKAINDMGRAIGSPLSGIQDLQSLLGSALSGQTVNAGSISRATQSTSTFESLMGGGNSEIAIAQNIADINQMTGKMGVSLSPAQQSELGSMKSLGQLTDIQQNRLKKQFGGKYKEAMAGIDQIRHRNPLKEFGIGGLLGSDMAAKAEAGTMTEEEEAELQSALRPVFGGDVQQMGNLFMNKAGSFDPNNNKNLPDRSAGGNARAALDLMTGTEQTRNEIAQKIEDELTESFKIAGKKISDAFSDPKNIAALFKTGGSAAGDAMSAVNGGGGEAYNGQVGQAYDVYKKSMESLGVSMKAAYKDSDVAKLFEGAEKSLFVKVVKAAVVESVKPFIPGANNFIPHF